MARDDYGRSGEAGGSGRRGARAGSGEGVDGAERAARRLASGIARSKAIAADYRARLHLLREALARPQGPMRPARDRRG